MKGMRDHLLEKLDLMNYHMEKLVEDLRGIDEAMLNKNLKEGKWSILQIMNHLILSEKGSLKYCQKKLSYLPELKKAGFRSKVNLVMLNASLYSPFKYNAPAIVSTPALPAEDSLDNVRVKWKESRSDLRRFFKEVDENYLDKEVYKHPFGMRFSLLDMLGFFDSHFQRHRRQINANLRLMR